MIIYYSGTGNSYSIAKRIGIKLNEKVVPMKRAVNDGSSNIVFVFPTYCMNIPSNVRSFIESFPINKNQKIIGVSTSGGDNGNSEYTFNRIMRKRGLVVDRFINIIMTDNSYPILFGSKLEKVRVDEEHYIRRLFECEYINKTTNNPSVILMEWILFNPVIKSYLKKKVDSKVCNGCGLCRSICPNDNITIKNEKAVIGNKCGECYGCIHACPKQAIRARRKIEKSNQYRNEHVKISELNR